MDDVDRLIQRFGASQDAGLKLDSLIGLERIREPRVLDFFLRVLMDPREPLDVRLHVLKHTRNGDLGVQERTRVVRAYLELLGDRSAPDLRLQTILALGGFTDVAGVVRVLCDVARRTGESFDIRYAAFTGLDRAGPTPEYLAVLLELEGDETLGTAARTVLEAWADRTSAENEETLP